MRVITASRRTDIPAFYTPWLLNRLYAGFAHAINPVAGQLYRVPLSVEDTAAVGLFTRDPGPISAHLPRLMDAGWRFWAHVTINGYPRLVEPSSPTLAEATERFIALSAILGSRFTIWRYDPIVLSDVTPESWHLARFEGLARRLAGHTDAVYVSFCDSYRKTERNLARLEAAGLTGVVIGDVERERALGEEMAAIAEKYGMRPHACAEPALEGVMEQGHCVDASLISALRPEVDVKLRPSPTRTACGCYEASDIGAYHTCAFGCAYCYATDSIALGVRRMREHDPADSVLWRPAHLRDVDLVTLEVETRDTATRPKSETETPLF